MRTLYLLRHAKAQAWDDAEAGGITDLDRPLTLAGRRAASALGEHLRRSGCRPQLVVCSPALRTRQTLDLVAGGLGLQARVQVDESIYGASVSALWHRVRDLPDTADEVLIVGHNPGLQGLAVGLADQGDDGLRARVHEKLPTGGFVTVAWPDGSWAELHKSGAVLHDLVVPRDL